MSVRLRSVLWFAGLAVLLPAGARAQTCYPGAPLPRCHAVVVTELGYLYRVNGPHGQAGAPQVHYLNGEVGYLVNRGARTAVGAALFAGALVDYDFTLRYGVKGRLRYWLGRDASLEAGAGPVVGRVTRGQLPDPSQHPRAGLTTHVALNLGDRLSLLAALETLRSSSDAGPSVWVGARLGSRPAAWAGGVAGVVLGLGAALFGS